MSNVLNFEVTANRLELKDGFRPVNTEYNYTQIRVKFAEGYGWENCTLITAGYFVSANQILSVVPSASAELTFTFAIPAEMRGSGVSEFHFGVVGSYVENGQTVTVATNIVTISAARGLLIGEVVDLSAYEKLLAAINAGLALKEDLANKVDRINSETNLNSTQLYPSIGAMIHYLFSHYYDKDDVDGAIESLETDVTAALALKENTANKKTVINNDNAGSDEYFPTINAVVTYLLANFYTQSQINSSFYTKTSVDTLLSAKADSDNVEDSVNELKSRIAATDVGRETAQGSVGISKLDFVTLGDNLFNKDGNHTPNSYVNASGKITSTDSYYLSEYIKVSADTQYYVHGYSGNDNYTKLRCVAEYDEKLTFIQRTENVSSSITTGANTAYVRIAFPPANAYMTYFGTAAYNNQRFSAVIPGALVDISEKLAPLQADIAGNTAKINAVTENPDYFELDSQVNDGITVTNHGDGSYTFNGTNSTTTLFQAFTLPAGTYTAKIEKESGSSEAYSGGGAAQIAIRFGTGDGETWLNANNITASRTFSAATPVFLRLNHGTYSNLKLKISITENDYLTAIDKIARSVTENPNLFVLENQTIDGLTVTDHGDGSYTFNGTNTTTTRFPVFSLPAGTYKAKIETVSGSSEAYSGGSAAQIALRYGTGDGATWLNPNSRNSARMTFGADTIVFLRLNRGTYTSLKLKISITENGYITAVDEIARKASGFSEEQLKILSGKFNEQSGAFYPIEEPDDFTWKDSPLHGKILTDFHGNYRVDFDVASCRNPIGKAYYVAPDGSDSNDGTPGAPLANMSTAYANGADTIYLYPGIYKRVQTLYTTPITRSLNVIGLPGEVIVVPAVTDNISFEFCADTNVQKGAYTSFLSNVVDLNKDDCGQYTKYEQISAGETESDVIAAVNAVEGSWCLFNDNLYIRTIGNVEPKISSGILLLNSGQLTPTPMFKVIGGNFYIENVVCIGGSSPLHVQAQAKTQVINAYAKNCKFFFSRSVSNDVCMLQSSTLSIFQDCEASFGMKDGFNYHARNFGDGDNPDYGVVPKAIEINCIGMCNGNISDGDDQGSTIHDGGSIIRVRDVCGHNYGSNYAEQGTGTESWNVGCVGFESWSPNNANSQSADFFAYADTKVFLDGCVSFGSKHNFNNSSTGGAAGAFYLRNMEENVANKVTSISNYSTDEQYPSAKLVYTKLDTKENKSKKVTSLSSSSTDEQYPSAKAVYDGLNTKENTSNKVTSLTSSSTDNQYPSAKAVYDAIDAAIASQTTDLSAAVVTLSASSYTYDGTSKVPSVTSVTLNGQTLTAGTDYAVVSSPATNAGSYTLTVNGIGSYSGTVTANWTINKAQATISGADSISIVGTGESESETYTTTGDGALSFSISDSSVATLSSSGGQVTVTGVAAGSATLTVTVADGTNYTGTTKTVSVAVTEASTGTVFGVVWDYSLSSPALTRLTALTDPLGVVTNCPATEPTACVGTSGGSSEFDNYLPWSGMIRKNYANGELVDFTGYDNGETYVFIPEFWSKIVDDSEHSKMYIYISSGALTGFTKHPGSGRYVGRYQCNTSMKSETGGTLRTSATLNDVRNAIVQTSNHYVFDVHTYMALVLLYTVEFASLDSQTMIGAGISSGSSVSTGQTDVLTHHTGRVSGETESLCAIHYRWVENIYGNVNDFIDGVIVEDSVVKLSSNPSDYSQSSAYVSTEISVPVWTSQAFITALTAYGNCYLFPKTLGGSDTTYLCDSYYSASGTNCVVVGCAYGGGTKAGIFYWNSGSASNIPSANNGSRPIIIPGGDAQ